MSLNDSVRIRRSGSSVVSSRVSRRPPAIAEAACAAVPNGRTARRAEKMPSRMPNPVVITAARTNDSRTLDRVESASSRLDASKYAPIPGMSQPTTTFNSSPSLTIWLADVPSSITRVASGGGTSASSKLAPPGLQLSSYQIR